MNVLSVFDGGSFGQLALQRAGVKYEKYFASETDKFAIQVTQDNFPNTIQLGDVKNIKVADLPKIDLLIGGSPCQGFSRAGNQLAFDDPRSNLFFEFVRLKNELKPKYFLFENVMMSAQNLHVITEALGVAPIMKNSGYFSAQERKRWYWQNISTLLGRTTDYGVKPLQSVLESGYALRGKSQALLATFYKENVKSLIKRKKTGLYVAEPGKPSPFRKLSVVECHRLQTAPDDFCKAVSKTQAYKILGNGWTVAVIEEFLKGINYANNP